MEELHPVGPKVAWANRGFGGGHGDGNLGNSGFVFRSFFLLGTREFRQNFLG